MEPDSYDFTSNFKYIILVNWIPIKYYKSSPAGLVLEFEMSVLRIVKSTVE